MVILGIDPGYAIVGYGVVQFTAGRYRSLEHGAIVTRAGEAFPRRLEIISDALDSVLQKHKIDAVSIEKLYFQNNKTTAIQVAEARGVILLGCQRAGLPIFEYTPLQVKSAVTGYGQAKKPQVMEMVRRLLCLKEVPKPDDTADALALAICHSHATGSALRQRILQGGLYHDLQFKGNARPHRAEYGGGGVQRRCVSVHDDDADDAPSAESWQ